MAIRGKNYEFSGLALAILAFCFLLTSNNPSYAQACQQHISNPAASSATEIHPYTAPRKPGRNHHGVDIMLPMCLPVQNQMGCDIIPNNTNGSPLWRQGGETTGYGFVTRYKCGPRVEVRYAHLNGYNANTNMAINGKSGASRATDPHIHYEVVVYTGGEGIKVDPQCVWGAHPTQSDCCTATGLGAGCSLGAGPANMCDDATLNALVANAKARGIGLTPTNSTYVSTFQAGGVAPESFTSGTYGGDLPDCPEGGMTDQDGDGVPDPNEDHIHDSDEGLETGPITNEGTGLNPGSEDDTPAGPPADTGPPGERGGEPDLVPQPEEGVEGEVTGCATDTWHSMVNQAVLESRRETVFAQRFIAKPDSVFPYVCFENQLKATEAAGPIFSENQMWNPKEIDILGKTVTVEVDTSSPGLSGALDVVVRNSLETYLNSNFNHGILGETAGSRTAPPLDNCSIMAQVWEMAKCKNFDTPQVFMTFEQLTTFDPREFPTNMKCGE